MIVLRARVQADDPFVISSWLHSLADALKKRLNNHEFREERARIFELVKSSTVLVACSTDDRDTILGWACARGPELLYTYTKADSRRLGVCRLICQSIFRNHPKFFCQNPTPRFRKVAPKIGCEIPPEEEAHGETDVRTAGWTATEDPS